VERRENPWAFWMERDALDAVGFRFKFREHCLGNLKIRVKGAWQLQGLLLGALRAGGLGGGRGLETLELGRPKKGTF